MVLVRIFLEHEGSHGYHAYFSQPSIKDDMVRIALFSRA